ncbi:fold protein [Trema orientale]|uniref:Fold protein n=1 Tax=Trema orientale TaxID=63057 RepID=A0A2P5ETC2_TREOI|nr:fold protein [Trema orientale]
MASDESMTVRSCISMQEDDELDDDFYGHHPAHHNFSRLSVCTSSSIYGADDDDDEINVHVPDDDDDDMGMYMSRLSIESFDGDVEDDFSDGKGRPEGLVAGLSSDSDGKESAGCYSLPATPPRRRTRAAAPTAAVVLGKECVSENEAAAYNDRLTGRRRRRRMRRRIMRERLLRDRVFWDTKEEPGQMLKYMATTSTNCTQSDQSHPQAVVFTRPKGGIRSLRMDMDEVKACRELGFELELDNYSSSSYNIMPNNSNNNNNNNINIQPLSMSMSMSSMAFDTASTTSGGNSPVSANWRISSPGDDPRDVKARLKVWAQAVALASASRHAT